MDAIRRHAVWIRPARHSAPRLSSVLRTPPLCRCAERPISLILHTGVVIAGLTRNPVVVWHWIPDVETPDLIRGRDDKVLELLVSDPNNSCAERPISLILHTGLSLRA